MAVTGYSYPYAFKQFGSGTGKMDFVADSASMKCALMAMLNFTGGNQSLSVADFWNDVSAYEIGTSRTTRPAARRSAPRRLRRAAPPKRP